MALGFWQSGVAWLNDADVHGEKNLAVSKSFG